MRHNNTIDNRHILQLPESSLASGTLPVIKTLKFTFYQEPLVTRMEARRASFNPTSFAEGRFRRAYKGTWISPASFTGRSCVVKELKSNYTWEASDWNETVNINERAKQLAVFFNSQIYGTSISFTEVHVLKVLCQSDPNTTPKLNEYVTCGDYIPGHFTKWCNNYAWLHQL